MRERYGAIWDWRRRVGEIYRQVREAERPEAAWWCWREARDRLLATHAAGPLDPDRRTAFSGLDYFDYDPSYRFQAALRPARARAAIRADGGEDGDIRLIPFAETVGLAPTVGGELTLYWIGGYGGGVLLPFKDATSGEETFGGGRYLLDTIKGADLGGTAEGRIVLDFNFTYNPSCAYADRWICPLSPPDNMLSGAVRAGERAFGPP